MAIGNLTGWSRHRGARLGLQMAATLILILGVALPAASLAASSGGHFAVYAAAPSRVHPSLRQQYAHLPISFEVNKGQTSRQVAFLAHTGGATLFLTPSAILLDVPVTGASSATSHLIRGMRPLTSPRPLRERTLGLRLLHASAHPQIVGLDPLPGKVNYFIGNNPAKWHANVPTYGRVLYRDVYPGIDLQFYGNGGQLEYDWVVHPGGSPTAIQLKLVGSGKPALDGQGDLRWGSGANQLVQGHPRVYQTNGGRQTGVASRFVLRGDDLSLALGQYDHQRVLVIDPTLVYSTYLGGNSYDQSQAITADGSGNAYVTGIVDSNNFPTTPSAFQTSLGGTYGTAFVTKLSADGKSLLYSTYLGGSGNDAGYGIAVDGSGYAYVTGDTQSSDFPTTTGAFQTSLGSGAIRNAFVTKLNATGSALLYSTYLGGNYNDGGTGIAVDGSGYAYVTGYTQSSNFPTTSGTFQTIFGGTENVFVTKLSTDGKSLVYSTFLGGSSSDVGRGIALDGSGNAYVTGYTTSSNFPYTVGAFQTALLGNQNAFVTKLNATGSALLYSTYLGGSNYDQGNGIAVDGSGNAYVTGATNSGNFPITPGAYQTTYVGNTDSFVTKLSADGKSLLYSTYLGGSGDDEGDGIAVDGSGYAYVTGFTASPNFPVTPGAVQTTLSGGNDDAFVSEFSPTGTSLVYSTYLGGSDADQGNGIAVDSSGNVYVTGRAYSTNFPTTAGAFQTTSGGISDAFVAKFTALPSLNASPVIAPNTTTTVTWSTGDGTTGQVWVSMDGGGEALFAQGATGSATAPWIAPGHTYAFSLYAGTAHLARLAGPVTVSVTTPPAFLSAGPNPVASGHSTVISWSTGSATPGQVWVSVNGRPDVLVATGSYGSLPIPWILPGYGYLFSLYVGSTHTAPALAQVTVRYAAPAILASPNPVSPGGSTTLDFSTGDGSTGTVCVSVNGGTPTAVLDGSGADEHVPYGPIGATDVDVFTLHAGAGCSGTARASTRVAGTAAPYITANPNPVTNRTTTTISYNTGNSAVGQVWVSVDGATEVLVIQGVSGSVSIPWIQPGHTYVFNLYAGTGHTPGSGTPLSSVTVTGFNSPTISASPNPVTSGSSTTVNWDTGDGSVGQVYVSVNGGPESLVAQGSSGSTSLTWIEPGNSSYVFTLYQGTGHLDKLGWVTVTHS